MSTKTCKERIREEYKDTMNTLRKLWRADQAGYEGGDFDPVTNGEECPVCHVSEAMEADENTGICKPCWDELEDLGPFHEYGLGFDYVPEGTFGDQKVAYFRYQLSWGGPSDEFRFFVNPNFSIYRVEYWFLDWYDGAHVVLDGEDEKLLEEIFDWFREIGSVDSACKQAKG